MPTSFYRSSYVLCNSDFLTVLGANTTIYSCEFSTSCIFIPCLYRVKRRLKNNKQNGFMQSRKSSSKFLLLTLVLQSVRFRKIRLQRILVFNFFFSFSQLALKKLVQGEVLLNPLCSGHKTLMHKKAAQKKELKRRRKLTCGNLFKLHQSNKEMSYFLKQHWLHCLSHNEHKPQF